MGVTGGEGLQHWKGRENGNSIVENVLDGEHDAKQAWLILHCVQCMVVGNKLEVRSAKERWEGGGVRSGEVGASTWDSRGLERSSLLPEIGAVLNTLLFFQTPKVQLSILGSSNLPPGRPPAKA